MGTLFIYIEGSCCWSSTCQIRLLACCRVGSISLRCMTGLLIELSITLLYLPSITRQLFKITLGKIFSHQMIARFQLSDSFHLHKWRRKIWLPVISSSWKWRQLFFRLRYSRWRSKSISCSDSLFLMFSYIEIRYDLYVRPGIVALMCLLDMYLYTLYTSKYLYIL